MSVDLLSLAVLPTWMAPCVRQAGASITLGGNLTQVLWNVNASLYDGIDDYATTDPGDWNATLTGFQAFLDLFSTDLAQPKPYAAGATETFAQELTRLLTSALMYSCPNKGSLRTTSWAITTLLGRSTLTTVVQPWDSTHPWGYPVTGDTLVPYLELADDRTLSFSSQDPTTTFIRGLLPTGAMIAAAPLVVRMPAQAFGGVSIQDLGRYSPWSRSDRMPVLTDSKYLAVPTTLLWTPAGPQAPYAGGVVSRNTNDTTTTFYVSRPTIAANLQGVQTVNPGAIPRDLSFLGLQADNRIQVRMPTDARLRGDPLLRVPGDAIGTATWRGIAQPVVQSTWGQAPYWIPGVLGVPLDLDNPNTTFPAYSTTPSYGTGTTPVTSVSYDHPLASDFA